MSWILRSIDNLLGTREEPSDALADRVERLEALVLRSAALSGNLLVLSVMVRELADRLSDEEKLKIAETLDDGARATERSVKSEESVCRHWSLAHTEAVLQCCRSEADLLRRSLTNAAQKD